MSSRSHPGRGLKRISNLLFAGGIVLLLIGLVKLLGDRVATQLTATPSKSSAITGLPTMTVAQAKQIIPTALKQIYAALDEGHPREVTAFLDPAFFTNPQHLDSLCQPFNYRAHYIASVIEAIDNRNGGSQLFRARVHILYKSVGEKVNLMYFAPVQVGAERQRLYLRWFEGDPLTIEHEAATETVRTFIYAGRAGQWQTAARLTDLDMDQVRSLTAASYSLFNSTRNIMIGDVKIVSDFGLKLELKVRTGSGGIFTVDPFKGGKIVEFATISIFDSKEKVVRDPEIENATLIRFGLQKSSPPAERNEEEKSKQPADQPKQLGLPTKAELDR